MADHAGHVSAPTTPLIGRERELGALRAALEAALAGHGGLTLIGGEAGIGKTALAEALLTDAAERGAAVLVGRCYDLSETPPYGPWVELFARAPADHERARLPAPLGDGATASGASLAGQTVAALATRAGRRPLVVLLDDLHWADPASLDLLRFVARQLAEWPILLLVTYRADEIAPDHPLVSLLPALVREARALRLDVRPLARGDLHALIGPRYALPAGEAARLVAYLHGRAEGNPFHSGELLRTLEDEGVLRRAGAGWRLGDPASAPVPPLLRQIIEGRVARLGGGARELLLVAAVLGQEVPLDLWAAVGEADEGALFAVAERALAAGLLAETPGKAGVRFAHALVREALYEALGALRRLAWHRKAGAVLAATPHPDPDMVAYHFGRAGDERAFAWLIRAGVRARRADAWLTSTERFRAAATLLEGDEDRARERGWLLYYVGLLLRFSDNTATIEHLNEAERLALLADDRVLLAFTHYQRGPSRCMRGEVRLGLLDIERGIAELDTLPPEYHLRSNDALALALIEGFLPGTGHRESAPSAAVAGPPATTPQRGVLVNWLAHSGRYREALAIGEAFIGAMSDALGAGHARLFPVHSGRGGIGHALAALGRPSEARRQYALARSGFAMLGEAFMVEYVCWAELLMVALPYAADDVAARAALLAEATRAWGRAGGTITTATHATLAALLIALVEGGWAEGRALAEAGLSAPTVNLFQGAISALGFLARHQGEPGLAWAQVRKLHPAGPHTEPGDCYFPHGIATLALAANLALDAGDLALAGDWLATHERWLDWSGAVLWRADHALLRARHTWAGGDLVAARRHAADALTHAGAPRQPLLLLAAHRLCGELATAASRHAEAADHLAASLALADACAAPYERALTLLALAELRAAQERRAEADALLDDITALLEPLSARLALARAAALAARLAGVGTAPAPPPARAAHLSPREAEVLGLLAAGRSNQQIAHTLSLSPRTVQRHVANVYLKIGAHNKADATAYALRHRLD